MKYVLFYPDLKGVSRDVIKDLLQKHVGKEYEATWRHDTDAEKVEVWVNPDHNLNKNVLGSLSSLKMLSLAFTGYDPDDLSYYKLRGLKVYYVPDYSADSVAELAVGLTLAVLRKILKGQQNLREGGWDSGAYPGVELHGKRVAVLGTGTIGTKTAKLFQAFGCKVVGWSKSQKPRSSDIHIDYEPDLREIFAHSDIIVLHLPVNDHTRHIVGAELLRLMKRTSVLVNTARAKLVDTDALVAALSEGRILGAGIDVFDDEERLDKGDLSANPYSGLDNVVTTPHVGFKTSEALHRLAEAAIKNIGNFLTGSRENLLE